MGAATSTSSKKRHGNSWSWNGPPGEHSPFPVDRIPYPGPDLLFCFVDLMVSHRIMKNHLNLGPPAVTTNIEQYLDRITDCYSQGFLLAKFVRVPSVKMTTEPADWTSPQLYQAILSKPASVVSDTKESWELKVEKRILSTRTLAYDQSEIDNDLLDTIHGYAAGGARLVSAEAVGYVRSETSNTQYGIMGVELFFNVPRHTFATKYTYHTVTVPATYHIVHDITQLSQKVVCDADFLGQLKLFLDAGWKLIDICLDSTAIAETYRNKAQSKRVETIWIFEKDSSKLFDETPIYEGAIIEYLHKVKVSSDCESPCRDWRPVIAGMGVSGWELASIVQTPLLVQSTFTVYTMKLLFIFQRPLIRALPRTRFPPGRSVGFGGGGSSGSRAADRGLFDTGPGYPAGVGSGSLRTQQGGRAAGGQLHGNSTMSYGPLANGYVHFTVNVTPGGGSSGVSGDIGSGYDAVHRLAERTTEALHTYTTRDSSNGPLADSNSSQPHPPRSTQVTRSKRWDSSSADKPRPRSGTYDAKKGDGPSVGGWCIGRRPGDSSGGAGFLTSSNDEEGGQDDNGDRTYSRYSSSISSSSDNGYSGVDFGKLAVFSPVVEIPTT